MSHKSYKEERALMRAQVQARERGSKRLTLDEAIDHALDISRNYPAEMGDDESLACVCQHHQLARWLTELRERRKLGYHPPCPSCRWRLRCVTTMQGSISKDWHCTMYEHSEEPFPAIPGEEVKP